MIEVKDLDFSYNSNRTILSQIAFDAMEGQCIAILGNNGAGKSTLIKCLNHILIPQKGVIHVNGEDVHKFERNEIAKCMAYVAQRNTSDRFTVFDSVLLGRMPYIKLKPKKEDIYITESIIKRMGLENFALRYMNELSGGEIQKVMLARALAQQPKVLLLDEPTSNLDLRNQYEVLATVQEIARQENISVIIVIHDLNLALRYCDRFLFVKESRVYIYGGKEVMTPENIRCVYGIPVAVETIQGVSIVVPMPQV
ncbi:ABC transporter ATP-binding protein [Clostridium sp. MSJ-4]|uniref:ABC transporter ATP-binding protein n=1 Tax=Clostridium simiarum TaxID=2841506 RepID=A0ABS6F459_9CLOT|nr:ABC transporter ATP-binding protein [Clostridium simiarum]MBU5592644.1 ABC transporter ATP-binding protein [Clostridium simiarum]